MGETTSTRRFRRNILESILGGTLTIALTACACPPAEAPPVPPPPAADPRPEPAPMRPHEPAASPPVSHDENPDEAATPDLAAGRTQRHEERQEEREAMVKTQLIARDIDDPAVLQAIRAVPRHLFVPARYQAEAYRDHPLPIGHDVTISQPYIVALMTQLAALRPGDRVLEIGTGSGYQAAVLDALGAEVYSIEIIKPLAEEAQARLAELGYHRVRVRAGDGYHGWPEHAPFAAILVTAAPPELPAPLLDQLAIGGRLVAPVGESRQTLEVVTRTARGYQRRQAGGVRFVPMTGEAQK